MLVTTKGRYAMRLMADVAHHFEKEGTPLSLRAVAQREGISMKYLEQLARPLVKSGLLKSVRGKGGGYVLAEPSAAIRAGDILRAAEGNILPVSSCDGVTFDCARIADCASVKFWIGLDRVIEDYVDGVMLKDIIDEGDVFFDVDKISQIVAAKLLEEDAG